MDLLQNPGPCVAPSDGLNNIHWQAANYYCTILQQYTTAHMRRLVNSSASQSWKWQLIGIS